MRWSKEVVEVPLPMSSYPCSSVSFCLLYHTIEHDDLPVLKDAGDQSRGRMNPLKRASVSGNAFDQIVVHIASNLRAA